MLNSATTTSSPLFFMPPSLTDQQQQAVQTTDGPVRIMAGSGTGKTHTLIARVAHLIRDKQVPPREILVLTFSNKAAHEFNDRLTSIELPQVHATTFHGLAAGFLRELWRKDFKIISTPEQEEILRDILYSQEREALTQVVMDFNNVRQAPACGSPWPPLMSPVSLDRLGELFQIYRGILEKKNAIDFTGLLTTLIERWKMDPSLLSTCQNRIQTIMVDDYQDVSPLQIEIVRQLAEPHRNLCVAGDPNQTIHSWRGAQISAMTDFMTFYPDATSLTLTKNFRNSTSILNGAQTLISHNEGYFSNEIEATLPAAAPIHLWESRDEWHQNEMLFYLLDQFLTSHNPQDIALLYRTEAEGRYLSAYLAQRDYGFQVSTLSQFWEHKEVRRFLEKLTAVRDIGKFPTENEATLFCEWFRTKLEEFIWHQSIPEKKAMLLMQLLPYAMAFDYCEIPQALSHFLDAADTAQAVDNLVLDDHINLLPLHASKGLEFPIVMILGLEEGLLPHQQTHDDPYWVAEERRLLYVGMTRAKEQLHLFRTRSIDSAPLDASRFIGNIGVDHLTYGVLPDKRTVSRHQTHVKKTQTSMF